MSVISQGSGTMLEFDLLNEISALSSLALAIILCPCFASVNARLNPRPLLAPVIQVRLFGTATFDFCMIKSAYA